MIRRLGTSPEKKASSLGKEAKGLLRLIDLHDRLFSAILLATTLVLLALRPRLSVPDWAIGLSIAAFAIGLVLVARGYVRRRVERALEEARKAGAASGISIFGKDIPGGRKVEEALRDSEERFRAIIEHGHDGILLVDRERRILYASPSYARLLGREPAELLGKPAFDFVHPEDLEMNRGIYLAILAKPGRTLRWEYRVRHSDGSWRWNEGTATNLLDDPRVAALVLNSRDVTEHRSALDAIVTSLREKEILVQELYHRTNNNMQVISSLLLMQSEGETEPRVLEAYRNLENRIGAMALVQRMLYKSRDLSNIELGDYVTELAELLRDSLVGPGGRVEVEAEVEKVIVLLDTAMSLGIVLNELVSNSLTHAFPGERRGKVRVALSGLDDGRIELVVADDGPGLPEGFDPLRDGSLGLSSAIGLVETQLKGSIDFESKSGLRCVIRFRDNLYKARV
ncbi:MAG TPA: PAS domain S-box protein [Rectinemataceae bacterium]|nr:PAS domain S-box protein [Rectinemataceae bacterium]